MSGDLLFRILIICLVLCLIWYFLIPLLPAPFGMIVMVVVVIIVIIWLLRMAGLIT